MAVSIPLDEDAVRNILPHREEMLLCRTATVDGEGGGTAELAITAEQWGGRLHCPHLFLVEALAQLCGLALAGARRAEGIGPSRGYLAEAGEMEFVGAVLAGTTVSLIAASEISFGPLHRYRVTAECAGEVLVRGCLTVATA